ncbi:MYG1 protein-like [Chrysoperla carnea]|uniref:MYG1 protein-like n=1 Tax=Chrysoperla carnea TaxID=189513 RepID=UPI001D06EC7B|nr:MYG1 protein-like [Chrysoperla carnea]
MQSGFTFKEPITIGTHDGVFHADEALACYLLQKIPQLKNAKIIRTRDPNVLDKCTILVDVGDIYDPKRHRYDHHHRDFTHTLCSIRPEYPNKKIIKLSSAGLIYAHFGKEIISQILSNSKLTKGDFKLVYLHVYEDIVEELDGIDNGIKQCKAGTVFRIHTNVSNRVDKLNPYWNSSTAVNIQELFYKAMELVGKEFEEAVLYRANVWLPARHLVKESIEKRFDVHKTGEIIELANRCPWKEHLRTLEKELRIIGKIKFAIFQDCTGEWRVQGVPDGRNCRVLLRDDWKGFRHEELSKKSGILHCTFVHADGFIGGNLYRDGVLEMAKRSLNYHKKMKQQQQNKFKSKKLNDNREHLKKLNLSN